MFYEEVIALFFPFSKHCDKALAKTENNVNTEHQISLANLLKLPTMLGFPPFLNFFPLNFALLFLKSPIK